MGLKYLRIGRISTTHGLDGKLKIHPTITDLSDILKLERVYLLNKGEYVSLELEGVSRLKSEILIKIKGFDDVETARKYIGKEVFVDRSDLSELKEDEYYIADLYGLSVVDCDGRILGTINDVIETGANDVYSVHMENGKDLLIPAIHECILDVDVENGIMKVHLLKGLLDEDSN